MGRLFFIFAIIPMIEVALLLKVGSIIGGWSTLALVILTAILGAKLVRQQGIQTLKNAQVKMQNQQLPAEELVTGLCILIAGVLLITPGIMTDLFGFVLLIPQLRQGLGKGMATWLAKNAVVMGQGPQGYTHQGEYQHTHTKTDEPNQVQQPGVIEGDFERKD